MSDDYSYEMTKSQQAAAERSALIGRTKQSGPFPTTLHGLFPSFLLRGLFPIPQCFARGYSPVFYWWYFLSTTCRKRHTTKRQHDDFFACVRLAEKQERHARKQACMDETAQSVQEGVVRSFFDQNKTKRDRNAGPVCVCLIFSR